MNISSYGRVKLNGKSYCYLVQSNGIERSYKRVANSPCRTSPNCDDKFLNLLMEPLVMAGFINGVEIVLRTK